MAAIDKNRKLQVYGSDYPTKDGSCIRDYIHVLDLADAHIKALRYLLEGGGSQVFNLGSETGISVLEILSAAQNISGKEIAFEITERRPGDPATLIASSEKARRILNWRPVRSDPETILKDAWLWHSTHPAGY
jgi:UDP-glucose 4-epimerase